MPSLFGMFLLEDVGVVIGRRCERISLVGPSWLGMRCCFGAMSKGEGKQKGRRKSSRD